jgi:signal transduction histidine kinase
MEALGQQAGGIAHEINVPTQFISDNLAFLAIIWRPPAEILSASRRASAHLHAGDDPEDVATSLDRHFSRIDLSFIEVEIPAALSQSQVAVERVATMVQAMNDFDYRDRDKPGLTEINWLVGNTLKLTRDELKDVADLVNESIGRPRLLVPVETT